jgi:hypothetical protein
MPAKKTKLTDAERAKRIRETAREIGTDNAPASFELAFKKVARHKSPPAKSNAAAIAEPKRSR